jgi:hypothetical protein
MELEDIRRNHKRRGSRHLHRRRGEEPMTGQRGEESRMGAGRAKVRAQMSA